MAQNPTSKTTKTKVGAAQILLSGMIPRLQAVVDPCDEDASERHELSYSTEPRQACHRQRCPEETWQRQDDETTRRSLA